MKYYSETLKKLYDSIEECEKAENEFNNKQHEKELKLAELKDIYEEIMEDMESIADRYEEYLKLKQEFIDKYGM